MKKPITLLSAIEYFNPGKNRLSLSSPVIEPSVQVVINESQPDAQLIVEYPDIPVDNYIHGVGTYIVGDVRMGHNNALEQHTRIVADGQPTIIGDNNLLQEMTIHISQLREGEVRIGNGNFCAHGATMHGSSIGNQNYFGPEVTILDDAFGGSKNFFSSGTVIEYATKLPDGNAYKLPVINKENYKEAVVGPSDDEVVFVNRRTGKGIPLKSLFHDDDMKFMSNRIVKRTALKMSATAHTLGGFVSGKAGKQPAMGYMIHHIFQMGDYYLNMASYILFQLKNPLYKKVSLLGQAVNAIFNGESYSSEVSEVWSQRDVLLDAVNDVLENLSKKMKANDAANSNHFLHLPALLDRPRKAYQKSQTVMKLDIISYPYPVIQTHEDVLRVSSKLKYFSEIVTSSFKTV